MCTNQQNNFSRSSVKGYGFKERTRQVFTRSRLKTTYSSVARPSKHGPNTEQEKNNVHGATANNARLVLRTCKRTKQCYLSQCSIKLKKKKKKCGISQDVINWYTREMVNENCAVRYLLLYNTFLALPLTPQGMASIIVATLPPQKGLTGWHRKTTYQEGYRDGFTK